MIPSASVTPPPGDPIELRIDRKAMIGLPLLPVGVWVAGLFAWLASQDRSSVAKIPPDHWIRLFMWTTVACLVPACAMYYANRRTARLVFTTHGIWRPSRSGGVFIPWAEVTEVKMLGGHQGATHVLVRSPTASIKIHAILFEDPYAVNRTIRQYVREATVQSLPVYGEQ